MTRFFMYLPWDDDKGMVNGALNFIERLDYLGYYEDTAVISPKYLNDAKIKKHDDLYIAGECTANIDFIGSKDGRTMTARELAEQFTGNLDRNHRTIHMWACYSGHGMEGVIFSKGKIGLAYKFWEAMHQAGFEKLTVYGYRFAVLDPFCRTQADLVTAQVLPGFKSLTETPDKAKILPGGAPYWRTGLDADGKVIPPAPLPRPASISQLKS